MKKQEQAVWSALTGMNGQNGMEAKYIIDALKKTETHETAELLHVLAPMVMTESGICRLSVYVFAELSEVLLKKNAGSAVVILQFLCTLRTL